VGGSSHIDDQTAIDDLLNTAPGDQGRVVCRRQNQDRSRQACLVVSAQLSTKASSSACGSARYGEVAYGVSRRRGQRREDRLPSFRNALQAFDFAVTPKGADAGSEEGEKK
jgi:hypothetical protein